MPSEQKLDDLTNAIASISARQSLNQDVHFRSSVLVGFVLLGFGFVMNRYDIQREPAGFQKRID